MAGTVDAWKEIWSLYLLLTKAGKSPVILTLPCYIDMFGQFMDPFR